MAKARVKRPWVHILPLILAFGGIAAPRAANAWSLSDDSYTSPYGGRYEFTGVTKATLNGETMSPVEALQKLARADAQLTGQIPAENSPIGGSVRVVLPDHDRLRLLAMQITKQSSGGAVEFQAERLRIDLHQVADAVVRSHLFSSVMVAEQNDTMSPDPAGADHLIWFTVRSTAANNAGPWQGFWAFRHASSTTAARLAFDPGTPPGVARDQSFFKTIRLAAANPGGTAAGSSPGRRLAKSGTGIVIDSQGHVLTNNHVTAGCGDLRVVDNTGSTSSAELIASDAINDLALLGSERRWTGWASFRDSHGLQPGESLVVTGFPLNGLVSPEMAVTTGSLTALAGMGGDTRMFQFSAPIQPGNSGGPVMDSNGRVVGIASAVINGLVVAAMAGVLPQNVNFAIKTDTLRAFTDSKRVALNTAGGRPPMSPAAIGELARKFTVKIECRQ
jgi:S1-C subfamily serine protease